jgi:hypothetical protein
VRVKRKQEGLLILAMTADRDEKHTVKTKIVYDLADGEVRYTPETRFLEITNHGDEPDEPVFIIIDVEAVVLHQHTINRVLAPGESVKVRIEPRTR